MAPHNWGGARDACTKVKARHIAFLRGLLEDGESCMLTLAEYARRIVRAFPGDFPSGISLSAVSRAIRGKLGYTVKAAQVKNDRRMTEVNMAKFRDFVLTHFDGVDTEAFGDPQREAADMVHWVPRDRDVVRRMFFTDESGFNLQDTRRRVGRAPRGKRLHVAGCQERGPNHTLAIIVSHGGGVRRHGGVVAHTWHRSGGRGHGFTRDRYVAFLSGPFRRYIRAYRARLPAAVRGQELFLVMDNASIHHGPTVDAALGAFGVVPVYLPPYSPELNPCELVFSKVKTSLRAAHEVVSCPRGRTPAARSACLRGRVERCLDAVSPANVRGYYRKCAWGNGLRA